MKDEVFKKGLVPLFSENENLTPNKPYNYFGGGNSTFKKEMLYMPLNTSNKKIMEFSNTKNNFEFLDSFTPNKSLSNTPFYYVTKLSPLRSVQGQPYSIQYVLNGLLSCKVVEHYIDI